MAEALIQIVDENDKPIRGASKPEAWKKGLRHRIVRITIMDENGRMLLQKRADDLDLFPGRWDNSAAGHVDEGEDYETAAHRELTEELGLKDFKTETMGDYYIEVNYEWRIMKRFTRSYKIVLSNPLPEIKFSKSEVSEIRWASIEEIKNMLKDRPDEVTDGLEQVIERFF